MQAAERQLVVATELYFRDSDLVPIHTLVAASYNVIRDLSKNAKAPPMAVKDYLLSTVPPEERKRILEWLNSFENFFKHADRDPGGTIELSATLTESMLQDAWAQYERLGGVLPKAGKIFKLWSGNLKDGTPEVLQDIAAGFKALGKQQFFESVSRLIPS